MTIDPSSARQNSSQGVECYDTAGLSPAHRFSYWNDTISAFLLRRVDDPEFDFAQLVQEAGVSSRTLCRLFAADGLTAMRWLWRQRLEHANRLLRERRVVTVSEAAMRSGFNDLSQSSSTTILALSDRACIMEKGRVVADIAPGAMTAETVRRHLTLWRGQTRDAGS